MGNRGTARRPKPLRDIIFDLPTHPDICAWTPGGFGRRENESKEEVIK